MHAFESISTGGAITGAPLAAKIASPIRLTQQAVLWVSPSLLAASALRAMVERFQGQNCEPERESYEGVSRCSGW